LKLPLIPANSRRIVQHPRCGEGGKKIATTSWHAFPLNDFVHEPIDGKPPFAYRHLSFGPHNSETWVRCLQSTRVFFSFFSPTSPLSNQNTLEPCHRFWDEDRNHRVRRLRAYVHSPGCHLICTFSQFDEKARSDQGVGIHDCY